MASWAEQTYAAFPAVVIGLATVRFYALWQGTPLWLAFLVAMILLSKGVREREEKMSWMRGLTVQRYCALLVLYEMGGIATAALMRLR